MKNDSALSVQQVGSVCLENEHQPRGQSIGDSKLCELIVQFSIFPGTFVN